MSVTPWDQAAAGDVGHAVRPSGHAPGMLVTPWDPVGRRRGCWSRRGRLGSCGECRSLGSCGECRSHRGNRQVLGMSVTPWDRASAGDVGAISFPQQGDAPWLPLCSVTLSALLCLFFLTFEMEIVSPSPAVSNVGSLC